MMRVRTAAKRLSVLAAVGTVWSVLSWIVAPSATETAVANGDTRTIHLYHTHTGESIDATFRVDGHYDQAVLDQLNHFLRDWRNDDQIAMDPRLFDTVWEVYRTAGADQPIQIYSAYRSPQTNAMLRRRSRAVAEHSQHILGKALDTTMPGMSMERIREIAMRMQRGGVGYYQSANFVHIDVGSVRSWPRMNYDQLARLFPDGKTVHIPSNGQPMARYEEARAEIAARGGTDIPPAQESQGFFAWLFGGSSDAPRNAAQPAAYANNTEGDEVAAAVGGPVARQPAPQAAPQLVATASAPRDEAPVAAPQEPGGQPASTNDRREAVADVPDILPLPPRRPLELAAAEEIPLPPTRPIGSFKLQMAAAEPVVLPRPIARPASDAIGGLIAGGTSSVRKAELPAIITQGTEARRTPGPALAFAAAEPLARPTSRDLTVRTTPLPPRSFGLRAASNQNRGEKAVVAASNAPTAPFAGPPIGLRRAARGVEHAAL